MPSHLVALCFDATDPHRLARFWATVLDRKQDGPTVLPSDEPGFLLRFLPTNQRKTRPNLYHFDLTSESTDHQQHTVTRALDLGGRHHDVGQLPEEEHVVLADPDGNEFCVIEPGNNFLAGCGSIGALAGDGTQQVGYFWSKALGWPLVWDQDQETAIQHPNGGTKITWGGPPVAKKIGKNRLHFDIAPPPDGDHQTEVERLLSLGATRTTEAQHEADAITLTDPDGNEFCVLPPRRPTPTRDGGGER